MYSRGFHLADEKGRSTITRLVTRSSTVPRYTLGIPGLAVKYRRFVVSSKVPEFSASDVILGAPDLDENLGRFVGETSLIFLDGDGVAMSYPPTVVDSIESPDGGKEPAPHLERETNIGAPSAIRWTTTEIPIDEAVRQFVFVRSLQITHTDSVSFDFNYQMARRLDKSKTLVRLAVPGNHPLVFRDGGRPYQAFIEGRTDGARYQLFIHLSDQELRSTK